MCAPALYPGGKHVCPFQQSIPFFRPELRDALERERNLAAA